MGTAIGAFIIGIIANGLNLLNVPPFYHQVVKGIVILVAVLIDRMRVRTERGAFKMGEVDYHTKIAEHFGFANSKVFVSLLQELLSVDEAELISLLPATTANISKTLRVNQGRIKRQLLELFDRGLVTVEKREGCEDVFCLPEDAGVFMDMILFDKRYMDKGNAFFERWKEFFDKEYLIRKENQSMNMRVIPVNKAVKISGSSKVIPLEDVEWLLKNARVISVQNCPCRNRERQCEHPLEVCVAMDGLAEYCLSRGIGRKITFEEAMQKIVWAEENGLVHQTVNSDHPNVICNCCSCCCSLMRAVIVFGNNIALSKSRFRSRVDFDLCSDCMACVKVCKFGCLSDENGKLNQEVEKCWGCGLCMTACPAGAINLVEVENRSFIPVGPGFLNIT